MANNSETVVWVGPFRAFAIHVEANQDGDDAVTLVELPILAVVRRLLCGAVKGLARLLRW